MFLLNSIMDPANKNIKQKTEQIRKVHNILKNSKLSV